MKGIDEIIDFSRPAEEIVSDLRDKSVLVPEWAALLEDYDPMNHRVVKDTITLKDKMREDGTMEKSARIAIAMEQLIARRFSEFTFSIPVRRMYSSRGENAPLVDIRRAIEAIYDEAGIDSENLDRSKAYYASCEIFTMWYAVRKKNNLYGFESEYKLKCKTYSPMNGTLLYPIFNELDDMIAMSFQYTKKVKDKLITFFETYTEDRHYIWMQGGEGAKWEQTLFTASEEEGERVDGEEVVIMKIPGVYLWRPKPVYHGLRPMRDDMEFTLSRNSNILSYNSAPVLKVAGALKGQEKKNEGYRVWRVENGGDVSYVSWNQSVESLRFQIEQMNNWCFKLTQMPDISFDKMASLGNIGYDARQTIFSDAHLRIGDESGPWLKFLKREFNVIKAFLKLMNRKWESVLDEVTCTHIITPFIPKDEESEINKRVKANGGKAIESQEESIERFGRSKDAAATLEQIRKENEEESEMRANEYSRSNSVF